MYVDEVIDSHYNIYQFPDSYEMVIQSSDIEFSPLTNSACNLLCTYIRQQPTTHVLWDQFIAGKVHPKTLSCLLNCYIQYGMRDLQNFDARKNGLSAARLFFLASSFRGSKNNGFYHICLLNKCSEFVKFCIALLVNTIENGEKVNVEQLEEIEKNELAADLLDIIRDIGIMVTKFQFFDEITSLNFIIDILIDITRLERNRGNILEKVPTETLSYSVLAFNAYCVLKNMFNENCGSIVNIGKQIMHLLLPGLLVDEQRDMELSTRQFSVIRDHHLSFIRSLTQKVETPFEPILEILLQHLLHRGPDRSELKPRQLQIILEVWRLCPNNVRIKMKYYLLRMVYDTDAKIRIVALETLFKLLSEPEEIEPEDSDLLKLMPATKHEFIVAVIFSTFQDPLLTVRAKAFSLVISLTSGPPTATAHHIALIKRVLVDPYLNVEHLHQTSFCKKDFHEFHQYLETDMSNFDPNIITNSTIYPGAKILLWVLNVHARNKRANIRRVSLILLCNLFLINEKFMEKYYLSLLLNSCSDCSMIIRKVAVSGLTDLILKYPNNSNVLKYWFKGLIHLVGDRDSKIQEIAVECMNRVILNNIKPYSTKTIESNNSPLEDISWRVLDYALNEKVGKYMMCLCEKWHSDGFLTDHVIKDIMTYVSSLTHKWTVQSLFLLQLISHQLPIKNMSPIVQYYKFHFDTWFSNEENHAEQNVLLTHAQMVLDIIFLNYKFLDKEIKQQFLNEFEDLLFNFKVPTRLISKSLDIYTVLQLDEPNKRNKNMNQLFQIICESMESCKNMDTEECMMRYIYTLGDIGLVQHLQIKPKFQKYLLALLHNTDKPISTAFKTIIVLTVGKLSIVDESFAKEAIVEFGLILKSACHPSIKINALTALADLCLRCTTLVEQAIPEMCVCLKSDSLSVKRVALKLLTSLILEDYIKLRDVAFFALLCMLEDSDNQVRQETSSFIINYLLIKNKDIMERKLIEVIFHFNGYTGERANGVVDCFTSPELKAFFSMEGESKKAQRRDVYRFMVTHMLDGNKLRLMAKICKNIFDVVVVDLTANNEVKDRAMSVMRDAFWIMKVKEMALTCDKPRESNNDGGLGTLAIVVDLVKKQLVTDTYVKTMGDYIIPSLLKLKYELDKNKKIHPSIMNDLRAYLCNLISGKSPAKKEIIDLISVDGDLITEILHDVKQQTKQHKQLAKENGLTEYETEDDDDDDDDDDHIRVIKGIDYVTWAQMMEKRDLEESSIDEIQAQIEEQLQPITSEVATEEIDSHAAAVANLSQLTEKILRPVKKDRKNSSSLKHNLIKLSKNESEKIQSAKKKRLSSEQISVDKSYSDEDDLPGYRLFSS